MLNPDSPDFWTEQLCPQAPDGGRHHWVPKRDGLVGGEPSYRPTCRYCKATHTSDGAVVPAGTARAAR